MTTDQRIEELRSLAGRILRLWGQCEDSGRSHRGRRVLKAHNRVVERLNRAIGRQAVQAGAKSSRRALHRPRRNGVE